MFDNSCYHPIAYQYVELVLYTSLLVIQQAEVLHSSLYLKQTVSQILSKVHQYQTD